MPHLKTTTVYSPAPYPAKGHKLHNGSKWPAAKYVNIHPSTVKW